MFASRINLIHRALLLSLILSTLIPVLIRVIKSEWNGPWFMISDLGTKAPESYFFTIGTIISSILMILIGIHFWQMENDSHSNIRRIGTFFVFVWAIGIAMSGSFSSNKYPSLHLVGAICVFTSASFASFFIALWSKKFGDSPSVIGGYWFPSLSIIITIAFHISHEVAHRMHPEVIFMSEMGDNPGWFALFTTLEWILGLMMLLILWSFKPLIEGQNRHKSLATK